MVLGTGAPGWKLRCSCGTGEGFTADMLITGFLSADRIRANSITANKLASDVGASLDLSSNAGINLRVEGINANIDRLRAAAVSNVQVLYALGSSSSTVPIGGWSAEAPDWVDGMFMWQKTVTTYATGKTEESEPTCLTGATGEAATTLRIDSSRGTVFKNNAISTVLSAVIYHGSQRITDITRNPIRCVLWRARAAMEPVPSGTPARASPVHLQPQRYSVARVSPARRSGTCT